jgi:hypothetical protein
MNRPDIEGYLEVCKKRTEGKWKYCVDKNGKITDVIIPHEDTPYGCKSYIIFPYWINDSNGCVKDAWLNLSKDNASFIISSANNAESIARYDLLMEKAFNILNKEHHDICYVALLQAIVEQEENQ